LSCDDEWLKHFIHIIDMEMSWAALWLEFSASPAGPGPINWRAPKS